MKPSSTLASVVLRGFAVAAIGTGCSGAVVDINPPAGHETTSTSTSTSPTRAPSSSSGNSANGGSASSGSVGSPLPPGGGCGPGIACQPNSGCATAAASGANSCAVSCTCGPKGFFECQSECADASQPTGCNPGAPCSPNSACATGSAGGGCSTKCVCDSTLHMSCMSSCPVVDAGCVDNVLCVAGDHWDPAQCRCVPNSCISQVGEACGGFVADPCQCAPGLVCVASAIPDKPGTCESAAQGCKTAADCTGPLPLLCAICSDGGTDCAHWACVGGQCSTTFCD